MPQYFRRDFTMKLNILWITVALSLTAACSSAQNNQASSYSTVQAEQSQHQEQLTQDVSQLSQTSNRMLSDIEKFKAELDALFPDPQDNQQTAVPESQANQ